MSGKPSRLRDNLTTIGAALIVGAGAYWFLRMVGAPSWGCYLGSLVAYLQTVLAVQVSKAVKRGAR